jgi:hypothetical protein
MVAQRTYFDALEYEDEQEYQLGMHRKACYFGDRTLLNIDRWLPELDWRPDRHTETGAGGFSPAVFGH